MAYLLFLFPSFLMAQSFPQKFVCLSVIDSKIDQQVVRLDEFAMARIQFSRGDWSYSADVIENRLNSLTVEHQPTGAKSSVHTLDSQVRHFHVRLDTKQGYSTVDCELRF